MLIMNKKRISSVLLASALILFLPAIAYSQSQPIVVLEYPNLRDKSQINSDNAFVQDHNYSATHKVRPDETLSHILEDYYSGSGLNMKFVELAIVAYNKHAFVKNNPNFLFADKTLKLPSLNQIQAMLLGENTPESMQEPQNGGMRSQEIYFIGG